MVREPAGPPGPRGEQLDTNRQEREDPWHGATRSEPRARRGR